MSQQSNQSSSCKPASPTEMVDWGKVLDGIALEPLERQIYEEHMKAMKQFETQKPVDPKSIPGNRFIEDEECSIEEEEDTKTIDENDENDEEKDERTKQRDQAKQDFEEDEQYHSSQFRKTRDWETRKRLALENLEQPIELATDVMELLMYGTPIQFVNKVPDPEMPDMEITTVLALYLTPECIARDQLFVDNETPVSLSLDLNPMGRNVFEIASGDEGMRGFPITYKSVVYIKVHYNEDSRDFFLTIDISSPYTVGKLFLQDTIDDLCQFQLLSVNKMYNKNQELVDINAPVLIRHVKTGFYVMSKVHITVMNICGEEKFVLGSDEVEDNNILWKLVYGSFNDDYDFDFDTFISNRWWQPELPHAEYIPPNSTIKDPFFCSKPSTSRDYGAGPSNVPFSRQTSHTIPETYDTQWVEVLPGLQKCLGPPGSANEFLDNPDELFTRIKTKTLGRTRKESEQIVVDYLQAIQNQKQQMSPPHSDRPDRKSCVNKVENTIDFMKKLNPKAKEDDPVQERPNVPAPNSIVDNPEKIISAIRKINLQNEMSPDLGQGSSQLQELFVWPTMPGMNSSTATQAIIKKLEQELIMEQEFEQYIPTKLSKDYDNENGGLRSDNVTCTDINVQHLVSKENKGTDEHLTFLGSKVDSHTENENVPLPENFWDFFDSSNTHLMYSNEELEEAESDTSTTVEHDVMDMEFDETLVSAGMSQRIEEGQGDMCPTQEEPDKDI